MLNQTYTIETDYHARTGTGIGFGLSHLYMYIRMAKSHHRFRPLFRGNGYIKLKLQPTTYNPLQWSTPGGMRYMELESSTSMAKA